jgi:hypothetical protein
MTRQRGGAATETKSGAAGLTPWEALSAERQTALRVEYGHYLDGLPPTCSLEEKTSRFTRWLAERGIHYSGQV